MLEIIFGWRKASKCKKLIRKVQCRLKLLKNKRCTIVRQLRDDVGQLLKHGHFQSAFNRVEQIYKDECIVAVYDLLDHFCEFIIVHLSYIRRHKDCPNDINEAVSTLIFASARCGDLPELRVIRKLFGERYGQRFASTALDLLPGHLVNHQMRENLSISSVDNDVKYRLVDEIAKSCFKSGPLALEYTSEFHLQQANKNDDFVTSNDICRKPQQEDTYEGEAEGKIVHVEISSGIRKTEEATMLRSREIIESYNIQLDCPSEHKEGNNDNESSSDNLSNVSEEMVYLDDIEEFKSPMNKEDDEGQDQRVFVFKHFTNPTREKYEIGYDSESEFEEQYGQSRKEMSTKCGGERLRKRSTSLDNIKSFVGRVKSEHPCIVKIGGEFVQGKFVCFKDETDQVVKHNCSLENPCYLSIKDEEKEEKNENQVHYKTTSSDMNNLVLQQLSLCVGSARTISKDQSSKMQTKIFDSTNASMCSCSAGTSPDEIKQTRPPYLRAITMPLQRPEDCSAENNIGRSYSFPYEQPSRFSSSPPHVHPKLPDYDELAAKFMALKKATLQNKK